MPDNNRKFHEFALQSILFKGRSDWYFCFLKTEKIAHVLTILSQQGSGRSDGSDVAEAGRRAASLSGEIAHLAAGEVDAAVVLADIFALMGIVRLLGVRGSINAESAGIIARECESVAERLVRGSNPSPFVTVEDFSVPALAPEPTLLPRPSSVSVTRSSSVKDIPKDKGQNKGQSERMSLILELVRKRKSVSIKEIASVIKDCSEKTIQRELNTLIDRGLIRREGERRWSVYVPV